MGNVLVERKGNRIRVDWPKDIGRDTFAAYVAAVRAVPGRSFAKGAKQNDPHWTAPLSLDSARALRSGFGDALVIGPELREWAAKEVAAERNLGSLASATTAQLERLPERLPHLYRALHLGPRGRFMSEPERVAAFASDEPSYQCADVKFLADSIAPANFNEMGLGKTLELLAEPFEAGRENGAHLVSAPKSVLETVWGDELRTWQDLPVLVASGSRSDRQAVVTEALRLHKAGAAFWLVVNPAMIAYTKDGDDQSANQPTSASVFTRKATAAQRRSGKTCACSAVREPHFHYRYSYPELFAIQWSTCVLDEAHRAAIGNTKSLTYNALKKLSATKAHVSTGTPMGGKPLKLFGILSYLRPDVYTSKWTYADRWLVIDEGDGYGKTILNKVRPEVRDQFNQSLVPYVLRRTKEEVLPYLPPKQIINVWVDMEGKQAAQYAEWEANADIEIGDQTYMGKGVLDIYTRMRQFAIAYQSHREGKLIPTTDSCKLEALGEILNELGIVDDDMKADKDSTEQIVIFSQFTEVVDMVTDWLRSMGVATNKITGAVKDDERTQHQRDFQEGNFQAMVMNVAAGGVGINLDRANTVAFMDETWNPDDQDQAMDRCHRASRIHQVTCYFLRSRGTIEEEVFDTVTERQSTSLDVLDKRRGVDSANKVSAKGTRKGA